MNTVLESVYEQARLNPDKIAIRDSSESVTYSELVTRAEGLAEAIGSDRASPGNRIAIIMDRTALFPISLLSVWMLKCAYVPLDPSYPIKRIETICNNASVSFLLCDNNKWLDVTDCSSSSLNVAEFQWPDALHSLIRFVEPSDTAYVIYTSGSTGTPKGVEITHRNLFSYVGWAGAFYGLSSIDLAPHQLSIGFDASITSLFVPLAFGKTVCPIQETENTTALVEFLNSVELNCLIKTTPTQLRIILVMLNEEKLAKLQGVFVLGGEPLMYEDIMPLRKYYPKIRVINEYGPTEATVGCIIFEVLPSNPETGAVPIGNPIEGAIIRLSRESVSPSTGRTRGEILIGGAGVAKGYINQPEETANRFIRNTNNSATFYHTGDIAELDPEYGFVFVGRQDNQVKIGGYRVEIEEVEAELRKIPGVDETAVIFDNDVLKSFVKIGEDYTEKQAFEQIRDRLPFFMVPSQIRPIEEFPVTENGKIDRKKLITQEPKTHSNSTTEIQFLIDERIQEPARNKMKLLKRITDIWSKVLSTEVDDIDADFFSMGGHSLLAIQVVAMSNSAFEIELPMNGVFLAPTPKMFNELVFKTISQSLMTVSCQRNTNESSFTLTSTQKRLWVLERLGLVEGAYNVLEMATIHSDLNLNKLKESFQLLVSRHTIFSWQFQEDERSEPIATSGVLPQLKVIDFRDLEGTKLSSRIEQVIQLERDYRFALETAPLARASIVQLTDNKFIFVLNIHHIIFDGHSSGIFWKELANYYEACCAERPSVLPNLKFRFEDYARQQNEQRDNGHFSEGVSHFAEKLREASKVQLFSVNDDTVGDTRGKEIGFSIESNLWGKVINYARALHTTVFAVAISAYAVSLYRCFDRSSFAIGLAVSNRTEIETSNLIGCFINNVPIAVNIDTLREFEDYVLHFHSELSDALKYQRTPLDDIVAKLRVPRDRAINPIFQTMFSLESEGNVSSTKKFGNGSISKNSVSKHKSQLGISMSLFSNGKSVTGRLKFQTARISAKTAQKAVDEYLSILSIEIDRNSHFSVENRNTERKIPTPHSVTPPNAPSSFLSQNVGNNLKQFGIKEIALHKIESDAVALIVPFEDHYVDENLLHKMVIPKTVSISNSFFVSWLPKQSAQEKKIERLRKQYSLLPNHDVPANDVLKVATKICAIFEQALRQKFVTIDDDFFEVGGDSLKMIRVINDIGALYGLRIYLPDVYNSLTPRFLAHTICTHQSVQLSEMSLVQNDDSLHYGTIKI